MSMKILGHPIHLMLIHFPTALFPMDLVCSIINYYTGNTSFIDASFYAICGGVIFGWFAVAFGLFDLTGVISKSPNAIKSALIHGGLNIIVVIAYTVLAWLQYKRYPLLEADSLMTLSVKVLVNIFMLAGNYFGGRLILKYKVAVQDG